MSYRTPTYFLGILLFGYSEKLKTSTNTVTVLRGYPFIKKNTSIKEIYNRDVNSQKI
jgi:hypothetical protein